MINLTQLGKAGSQLGEIQFDSPAFFPQVSFVEAIQAASEVSYAFGRVVHLRASSVTMQCTASISQSFFDVRSMPATSMQAAAEMSALFYRAVSLPVIDLQASVSISEPFGVIEHLTSTNIQAAAEMVTAFWRDLFFSANIEAASDVTLAISLLGGLVNLPSTNVQVEAEMDSAFGRGIFLSLDEMLAEAEMVSAFGRGIHFVPITIEAATTTNSFSAFRAAVFLAPVTPKVLHAETEHLVSHFVAFIPSDGYITAFYGRVGQQKVTADLNSTTIGTSVTPAVPVLIGGTVIQMVLICKQGLAVDLVVQICRNLTPIGTITWAASNTPYQTITTPLYDITLAVGDFITFNILASDGTQNARGVATAVLSWS